MGKAELEITLHQENDYIARRTTGHASSRLRNGEFTLRTTSQLDMDYLDRDGEDGNLMFEQDSGLENLTLQDEPDTLDLLAREFAETSDEEEVYEASEGPVKDPIQLYLQEIGEYTLLSKKREQELGQLIKDGKSAQEMLPQNSNVKKRFELELAINQGKEAKDELIQANLRLVVSVAKKYAKNMPILDCIQEGNLGLMHAAEKFDHTKGFRFSTYATWWIRQAVTRGVAETSRLIRLPVHLGESIGMLRRTTTQLEQALERPPKIEEIAEAMGFSPQRIRNMLRAVETPLSFSMPVGDEGDVTFGDFIEDERVDVAKNGIKVVQSQEVQNAVNQLPERERKVIQLRYGLIDGKRRTLEEVGASFGITRERVRQIEDEAMKKLRNPENKLEGSLQDH